MTYIKSILFLSLFAVFSSNVFAGNQQYEVLKDETRNLMSSSVADSPPKFSSFYNINEETKWISQMDIRLSKYISDPEYRIELLKTVHYEATRAGLDPLLILGLMQVESGFKKYAFSSVGARGYMQIMPFWIDLIGDKSQNLFHLRTNLRYGCTILKHYLDLEHGNLFMALGRYNGSRGKPEYPNAVLGARNQFRKGQL
jgi:soluble lytic murein transglycosylase-like protein